MDGWPGLAGGAGGAQPSRRTARRSVRRRGHGRALGPSSWRRARFTSRPLAFGSVALLGLGLAVWAARTPAPTPGALQSFTLIGSALRRGSVLAGFWLIALPSLLFGALTVLAPLSLDAVGVGALGMTIFWLASAAIGAVQSPLLGRWSDRRGRLEPVRVGLAASIAVSLTIPFATDRLALVVLILLASLAYNSFWVPGGALLTEAAEASGLGHGFSFALFNLAWAPAGAVGAIAGGALADHLGDATSYSLLATLCATTLLLLTPRRVAITS